jgi:hypothetical protein
MEAIIGHKLCPTVSQGRQQLKLLTAVTASSGPHKVMSDGYLADHQT